MTITITLPESVTFTRGGHEMTFTVANLSPDIIVELVAHGLTQKVGDAAAGKSGDEALAAMQKVYDGLAEGYWGVKRSGAAGRSTLETAMIALARKAAKPGIAGYKGMTPTEQNEAIWAYVEGLSEAGQATLRKAAEDKVARDATERAAMAAIAKLV